MPFTSRAFRSAMTASGVSNRSTSYIFTARLSSIVPLSCHCHVVPGDGRQIGFGGVGAFALTRMSVHEVALPLEHEPPEARTRSARHVRISVERNRSDGVGFHLDRRRRLAR